jgi:hypothetical protein
MSVRIRSEGALDSVEDAIRRYEKIEELLRFPVESVHHELPSAAVDEAAVARLDALDGEPVRRLAALRRRVAEAARAQLRKRDIEPTATGVEDLLAQLIARSNVPRRPKAGWGGFSPLKLVSVQLAGGLATGGLIAAGFDWWAMAPLVLTTLLSLIVMGRAARGSSLRHDVESFNPVALVPFGVFALAVLVLTGASRTELGVAMGVLGLAMLVAFLSRGWRD